MNITINGKELPLRFGMHLGEMLVQEAAGKPKIGTIQFMSMLIYYAHENYCLGYDLQPAMTKGEVYRFLEENNNDEALALKLQEVIKAYGDSQPGKTITEAAAANSKAKKDVTYSEVRQFAFGVLGLKPWEYYRYTAKQYNEMLQGYELKRQLELDKFRFLGTVVAQVGGAKKIKRPKDLMKLPLIDDATDKATMADMIEFMKQERAKAGGG